MHPLRVKSDVPPSCKQFLKMRINPFLLMLLVSGQIVVAVYVQDDWTWQPQSPTSLSSPPSGTRTMRQAEPQWRGHFFSTPDEITHLHGANAISSGNEDAIISRAGKHVQQDGSYLPTEGEDGPSGVKFALVPDPASIFNYEKAIFSSNAAGLELMMNGTLMTETHLSNRREKISSPLQALLNSNNPQLRESISALATDVGRSLPMISIFRTSDADKLGETEGTRKKKDESETENGILQLHETAHTPNGGLLVPNDKVQLSITRPSTENPVGLTSQHKQYTSTETFVSLSSLHTNVLKQGQHVSIDASPVPHVWTSSAAMGLDAGSPANVHVANGAVLPTAVLNLYSRTQTLKEKQASVFNPSSTKSPLLVKDHSARQTDLVLKPDPHRELLFHMEKEQTTQLSTRLTAKTPEVSKLVTGETLQVLHVTSESRNMSGSLKSTAAPLVSHIRHESDISDMDNQTPSSESLDSNLMLTEPDKVSALVRHSFSINALTAASSPASALSEAALQLVASARPAAPSPDAVQVSAPPPAASRTPAPSAPASQPATSAIASQPLATLVASAQPSAALKAASQPSIRSAAQYLVQSSASFVSDVPAAVLFQKPNELQTGTKVSFTQSATAPQSSYAPASPSLSSAHLMFPSHPSAPPASASLLYVSPATTFHTLPSGTSSQFSTSPGTASQTSSPPSAASQISVPSPAASNASASPTGVSHIQLTAQPSAPSTSPSQDSAPLTVHLHTSAPSTPVSWPSASSAAASEQSLSLNAASRPSRRQSADQHLAQSSDESQTLFVTVVPVKVSSLNPSELQMGTKVALSTASSASPVVTSQSLAPLTVPPQRTASSEFAYLSLAHSPYASHPFAPSTSSSQSSTISASASSFLASPTTTSQISAPPAPASQSPTPSPPASQPLASIAAFQPLAKSLATSQHSASFSAPSQPSAPLKADTLWPQSAAQYLARASAASQPVFVAGAPVTVTSLNPDELQIRTKAQAKSIETSKFVKATSLQPLAPNMNMSMFVLSGRTHPKSVAASLDVTKPSTNPLSPETDPLSPPSTISAFAKLERQNLNLATQSESPTSRLTPDLTLPLKLFSLTTRNLPLRLSSSAKNNPGVTHTFASLEAHEHRKDRPTTFIEFLSFNKSEKDIISLLKQHNDQNKGAFPYISDDMRQRHNMSSTSEYSFKNHNENVHAKQDPSSEDDIHNATQDMPPSMGKILTQTDESTTRKIEGVTSVIVRTLLRPSDADAQAKLSQFNSAIESPVSPSNDLILTPAVVVNQPREERGTSFIDRTENGKAPQQRFLTYPFTGGNRLMTATLVTQPMDMSKHASSGSPHSSPERQTYRSTENKDFSETLTSPLPPTKSMDQFASDLPSPRGRTSPTSATLKERKQNAAVYFSQLPAPLEWLVLKGEPSVASERSSPNVQMQQSTPSPLEEDERRTLQSPVIQTTGQRGRNLPGNLIKKLMEEAVRSEASLKAERLLLLLDLFLSGLAEVSDDICGTGNLTANVILSLERELLSGDSASAIRNLQVVISVKANSSQENLTISSCCVSPMPLADQPSTTCCLFSRLPTDPWGIRPLPGGLSESTSLAIHLYRVANGSVARLHCDVSACPGTRTDCETGKLQSERHRRAAVNHPGTWISFGPVLRGKEVASDGERRGPDKTSRPGEALGLGWGCMLLLAAFTLLCLGRRRPWTKSSESADQSQSDHWV